MYLCINLILIFKGSMHFLTHTHIRLNVTKSFSIIFSMNDIIFSMKK